MLLRTKQSLALRTGRYEQSLFEVKPDPGLWACTAPAHLARPSGGCSTLAQVLVVANSVDPASTPRSEDLAGVLTDAPRHQRSLSSFRLVPFSQLPGECRRRAL